MTLKASLLLILSLILPVIILLQPMRQMENEMRADWGPLATPHLRDHLTFNEAILEAERDALITSYRERLEPGKRTNGVLYFLARAQNLDELFPTILQVHDQFNHKSKYPVIFFTERTDLENYPQDMVLMQNKITSALSKRHDWESCSFALECRIPPGQEHQGPYTDESLPRLFPWESPHCKRIETHACLPWPVIFAETVFTYPASATAQNIAEYESYTEEDVPYKPVRVGYRHMCRFMTFVQNHPLMLAFDYYWRIDDDSQFLAPMPYDPLELLAAMNKTFGWTVMEMENKDCARQFLHTLARHRRKLLDRGEKLGVDFYNYDDDLDFAIFFNNFEIGKLSFWREPRVREYLAYIDNSHGTFKHRWGDAPIRTGAVSLFLPADQVHYFADIRYTHDPDAHQLGRENIGETSLERQIWRLFMRTGTSFTILSNALTIIFVVGVFVILVGSMIDPVHPTTPRFVKLSTVDEDQDFGISGGQSSGARQASRMESTDSEGLDFSSGDIESSGGLTELSVVGGLDSRRFKADGLGHSAGVHNTNTGFAQHRGATEMHTPAYIWYLAILSTLGLLLKRTLDLTPVPTDVMRIPLTISELLSFSGPVFALVGGYAFFQRARIGLGAQRTLALRLLGLTLFAIVLCAHLSMKSKNNMWLKSVFQRSLAIHVHVLWMLLGPVAVLQITSWASSAHQTLASLPQDSFRGSLLVPENASKIQSSGAVQSNPQTRFLAAWVPLIFASSIFVFFLFAQFQHSLALAAAFVCGWVLALHAASPLPSAAYPARVRSLLSVGAQLRDAAQRHRAGTTLALLAIAIAAVLAASSKLCADGNKQFFFNSFYSAMVVCLFALHAAAPPTKKSLFNGPLSSHAFNVVFLHPIVVMFVLKMLAAYELSPVQMVAASAVAMCLVTLTLSLLCYVIPVEWLTPFRKKGDASVEED